MNKKVKTKKKINRFDWGGASSDAWKKATSDENIGGTMSGIAGAATGLIGTAMQNAQIDASAQEAELERVKAQSTVGSSLDSIQNMWQNTMLADTNITASDVRGMSAGQMASNTLGSIASGASAGASVGGPWGAVAGAVVGLGTSLAGIFTGNAKARRKARELNKAGLNQNDTMLANVSGNIDNVVMNEINQAGVNRAAYGGPLHDFTGDFTNGITFINEGGTHEQNPFEGVMVGVDNEGTPNLVEEGEVIWNDYVFSDRLKPTKKQLKDGGYTKYDGWTFAKIAEDFQKASAETPNDKIAIDSLNDRLGLLITMQESVRESKNKTNNVFAYGGQHGNIFQGVGPDSQYLPYSSTAKSADFKWYDDETGEYNKAYLDRLNGLSLTNDADVLNSLKDYYNKQLGKNVSVDENFLATVKRLGQDRKFGEFHKAIGNTIMPELPKLDDVDLSYLDGEEYNTPFNDPLSNLEITLPKVNAIPTKNDFNWQSLGRYAPVITSAASLLNNVFQEPDYSNANAGLIAMQNVPTIKATPIGGKQQYTPVDRNYLLNKQLNASRAASRDIQNQATTRSQALAHLANQQYNTQTGIADALIGIERENLARKMQTAQFNLGIDQFNTQQDMQAQMANQQRGYNIAQAAANAGQLREAINAQRGQAISADMSGLASDLAGIGTEAEHKAWLDNLVKTDAIKDYLKAARTADSHKNGGRLLTKKRK